MNKRTKSTENNTMMYMVENDNVKTTYEEEDPSMGFESSIVLFTMYPVLVNDGDTTMVMEHGMALLEMALTAPSKLERSAIAGILVVVASILNMDKLVSEAIKLLSDDEGITGQLCANMGSEIDDVSKNYEVLDQLLELLGIDSSKKQRALDEIFTIVRLEKEL